MAKDRGLTSAQLLIYLNEHGYKYDPYVETFRHFINRLNIHSTIYNKLPKFLKSDVDLKISKIKKVGNN